MTPLELCEPLFQYVCRVNRASRKGGSYSEDTVRAELTAILERDIQDKLGSDPELAAQFDPERGKLMVALLFFVDYMIRNSDLSFAGNWSSLAEDAGEGGGDRRFFDLLDETLAQAKGDGEPDKGDRKAAKKAALDRLAVYYTCIGLGFCGDRAADPAYLQDRMRTMAARLRAMFAGAAQPQVCPEAYQNVNTEDLIEKPATSLVTVAIVLVCMLGVLFAANAWLFRKSTSDLGNNVRAIVQTERPAAAPATAPTTGPAAAGPAGESASR